jgi:hypothetical protein
MVVRGSPTSSHSTCIGMSTALSSTARYCTTLRCTALSCALPLSPGPSGVDLPAGLSRRLLESLLGELHLVAAMHSTQCSMLNEPVVVKKGDALEKACCKISEIIPEGYLTNKIMGSSAIPRALHCIFYPGHCTAFENSN